MEYLEGFFLGEYWTDSDFRDRPHPTLFAGISILVFILTVLKILLPSKVAGLFLLPTVANVAIGIILLIGLPFLASVYYKQNPILRLLILLAYVLQYYCLFLAFVQIVTANIKLDFMGMPNFLLGFFDDLMIISTDFFNFLGSLGSTIVSVAFGIIIGGIVGLVLVFLAICLPFIYLVVFRQIQRLVDRIIYKKRRAKLYN